MLGARLMLILRLRRTDFILGFEARVKGQAGICSVTLREAIAKEAEATAAEKSGTRSEISPLGVA